MDDLIRYKNKKVELIKTYYATGYYLSNSHNIWKGFEIGYEEYISYVIKTLRNTYYLR